MHRKTLSFLALFCVLSFPKTHAQVSIGLKAVPIFGNGSKLTGDFTNLSKNKGAADYVGSLGFLNIAASLGYSFHPNFSAHTELGYKVNGFRNIPDLTHEFYHIFYTETPLLLRFTTTGQTLFFVQGGFSSKFFSGVFEQENGFSAQDENIFEPVFLSGILGAGFTRKLPPLPLLGLELEFEAELRYTQGLTNSIKPGNHRLHNGDDWQFGANRMNTLELTLGLHYRF